MLQALARYGGVYLDATCVTLQPLEAWVDVRCESIQGFFLVDDGDTMESWATQTPHTVQITAHTVHLASVHC